MEEGLQGLHGIGLFVDFEGVLVVLAEFYADLSDVHRCQRLVFDALAHLNREV